MSELSAPLPYRPPLHGREAALRRAHAFPALPRAGAICYAEAPLSREAGEGTGASRRDRTLIERILL